MLRQSLVVERRQRRAFAARGDIGMAEAVDDIDAQRLGDARADAELAREAALRAMEDGLAVQADEGDALARDVVAARTP